MKLSEYQAVERKSKKFGRWLKGRLAENGITQTELADALDISKQALSHRIRNNVPFDYKQMLIIFSLTKATGDDIARLMTL